jgi:glycosyltransferase involved in cell wall biosynthesis
MHSGKPLLATSIPGHLQILDDESACLVEPTAAGLAQGLLEILQNPGLAADRAMAAQQLAMRSYDITQYIADVAEAYLPVGGQPVSAPQLDRASGIVQGDLVRAAG